MADMLPEEPMLPSRRPGLMLLAMLLVTAMLVAVSLALPHNPYIRYQQFADGDFSRVRWVYERIHYDPTPIDVAILGSSRTEAAVSGPKLGEALSAQLGRPVHVVNLAVPMEGRDTHWVIAEDLLETHPETRLVLLSLVEPIRLSHPAFRRIADTKDVLTAPVWVNYYWLENAAFQPYRNMSLFVQSLFPKLFGMDADFNPDHYARYGADFDSTSSYRLDNGALVDRERFADPVVLEQQARMRGRPGASRFARLFHLDDNVIENHYTASLARQLRQRCTSLVLIYMPLYRGILEDIDFATNAPLAPILVPPPEIGNVWSDFSDAGHLRRDGIDKVTAWLPGALSPHLGALRDPESCSPRG